MRRTFEVERLTMSFSRTYYVYLLTNWNNKVMYVGMTNNLERRLYEHRMKLMPGFTERYNVCRLVYFEETNEVGAALEREKEIKKWRREKKNRLVEKVNPEWKDLSEAWVKISPFGRNDKTLARNDGEDGAE
jgi:putative endonuclease